jgi:uncharacterized membrane protein
MGGTAIAYFYFSVNIFTDILKQPLKMISAGMLVINLGIFLVAFMTYRSINGIDISFFGISPSIFFYALYFLGSIMVILGSRKFSHQPSK